MSEVGPKATSEGDRTTSALPARTDIGDGECYVRFVPKSDIYLVLFDHLGCSGK
jgi:hypothetical protein